MKKICAIIILLTLILFGRAPAVSFASDETEERLNEIAGKIDESIKSSTDSDISDKLEEFSISVRNSEGFGNITLSGIITWLTETFLNSLKAPVKMLGRIMAAALLCTIFQNISEQGSSVSEIYNTAGILTVILSVYSCIDTAVAIITSALETLSVFMLSYIPIFASVTASAGHFAAAGSYYGSDLFLCECIAFASKTLLMPLVSVLTAMSVTGAINPDMRLGRVSFTVKKAVQWILGILTTLFTGLLTIQSTVGASADSLRSKAVRLTASSFIPFVGGAVSESYSAIKGSIGVIKTGTGAVGVIIIALIVIPPIIAVIADRAAISLGKLFCEMLGLDRTAALLDELGTVLAIAMSVLIYFSIMFVISTCMILMTTLNIGG